MQHPSGIPEKIVRNVFARRRRLHAFEAIDPKTAALIVIGLDEATVANDDVSQCMTETVNALAAAVRQSGGVVAWVLSRVTTMPRHFTAILGAERVLPGQVQSEAAARRSRRQYNSDRGRRDEHLLRIVGARRSGAQLRRSRLSTEFSSATTDMFFTFFTTTTMAGLLNQQARYGHFGCRSFKEVTCERPASLSRCVLEP